MAHWRTNTGRGNGILSRGNIVYKGEEGNMEDPGTAAQGLGHGGMAEEVEVMSN